MSNIRWILQRMQIMKWSLIRAIVLCVLDMVSLLGITGIQKWLIDDVFLQSQYDKLVDYLFLFCFIIVGYNAVHLFSFMLNRDNEYTFQKQLSLSMMNYLYRMKAMKYHSERIGSITQRFSSDIGELSRFIANTVPKGITSMLKILVLSLFVGWANPLLLVLVCVLSIILVLVGRKLGPQQKKLSREVQEAKGEVLVCLEEGISSTREVIAFHRHDWELRKYREKFIGYYEKIMLEGKLQNIQLAYTEPLRWGINLFVLGYGAYLSITQQISVGTFVVVYQYSTLLLEGIQEVFGFGMNFSSRLGIVDRIREFRGETESEDGDGLKEEIRAIVFDQITFRYNDEGNMILRDLHLVLPAGKKVAFVGESGSGKSTIAQLLERFFEPTSGEIRVNDKPLQRISMKDWRKRVNLVSQEPYLFPDTIRNNLMLGRVDLTEQDIQAACEAAEIHDYISSLPEGYETVLGERGITLSGGQRQRLAIARSILSNSEILILDEATSALDLETERRVQANLDELRHGKTTIIIAHRLSTIENSDVIYELAEGKVVRQGSYENLFSLY